MAAWHRSVVATWQHRVHHPHSWRRCCNRPTPLGSPVAPKLGHLRPKCLWRRQAWLASRRLYLPNVCASDPPLQPTSSLKLGGSTKPTSQERVRGGRRTHKGVLPGEADTAGLGRKAKRNTCKYTYLAEGCLRNKAGERRIFVGATNDHTFLKHPGWHHSRLCLEWLQRRQCCASKRPESLNRWKVAHRIPAMRGGFLQYICGKSGRRRRP